MKTGSRRRVVLASVFAVTLAVLGGLLLPALARHSNCGGNTAARVACNAVLNILMLASGDRDDSIVSIATLEPEEFRYFEGGVAGLRWLGEATILINPAPFTFSETRSDVLVAVCNKPYDNVPRPLFGKAPFTHAAVYADGRLELVSVADCKKLDLAEFVDIKTISAPEDEKARPGGAE